MLMYITSENVGWPWMVLSISSTVISISMIVELHWLTRLQRGPMMWTPRTSPYFISNYFDKPWSSIRCNCSSVCSEVEFADSYIIFFSRACSSVRPTAATSGESVDGCWSQIFNLATTWFPFESILQTLLPKGCMRQHLGTVDISRCVNS